VVTAGYRVGELLPPPTGDSHPQVIAASTSAAPAGGPPESGDESATQFASDRRRGRPLWSPGVVQASYQDWQSGPTPADGPAPWDFGPGEEDGPRAPRFYLRGEYLLWWARRDSTPPLVTTSSPADNGILGRPTTRVLFGGPLDENPRSGGRFAAGYFLDDCGDKAVELEGFFLGQRSARFAANSAMNPVLARPFFAANFNTEFAELVASPGISTGSVQVNAPSSLWGIQANLTCKACCGCNYRVNVFGGPRYLDLDESITITENVQGLAGAPAPFTNANTTAFDHFSTHNQFFGGQLGASGSYRLGRWSLDVRGQLGLGGTHQTVTIDGATQIVAANGAVQTFQGALLALPSNMGHFTRDRFSVVPEVGVNLSYHVTDRLRAFVGYNFLYWTNVARPGDQIDRVLDVTLIPAFAPNVQPAGQNRPAVLFRDTDFWAQGLQLGLEYTF
jgi:hypothetical protein